MHSDKGRIQENSSVAGCKKHDLFTFLLRHLKMFDNWFEERSQTVDKCYTLLSVTLGVVFGELITRLVFGFESLVKTLLFEPKKSRIKVIKNLWLCMADKNGQIWKVANVLTKLRLYH